MSGTEVHVLLFGSSTQFNVCFLQLFLCVLHVLANFAKMCSQWPSFV